MDGRPLAFATIASFTLIFLFEYVFHGILLQPEYLQTRYLWRSQKEMESLFDFMLLRQMLEGGVIAWIFGHYFSLTQNYKEIRFYLYVGLLMGLLKFGLYVYMPISFTLAVYWLAGYTLLGIVIGLVTAQIYIKVKP